MLDSQLETILQSALTAGFAARGMTVAVQQNNQPRQFAAPSVVSAFFSYGSRKKYGWPAYKDTNNHDGTFTRTRTQVVHTRFTVAGFAPRTPAGDVYSSADIANTAADILQDEDFVALLVSQYQANVFRVVELPAIWFQDSNGQNVLWSSFDIIFTHKDVLNTSIGTFSDFVGNVKSV